MHGAPRRAVATLAVALALVGAATACGGGSSGGTTHPKANAAAQIRVDWIAFFSAETPTDRRVMLLEDGSKFSALISQQEKSPLARSSSVKVQSVQVTGPDTATVHYTVLLGGKPALQDQTGKAVKQGGRWKVSDDSFCGLLALQSGGKPPAPCPGA